MNIKLIKIAILVIFSTIAVSGMAADRVELETTIIKGNDELPKILYIIPWKDVEQSKTEEQKLVLHSLFGDLFDPVYPQQ